MKDDQLHRKDLAERCEQRVCWSRFSRSRRTSISSESQSKKGNVPTVSFVDILEIQLMLVTRCAMANFVDIIVIEWMVVFRLKSQLPVYEIPCSLL